MDKYSNYKKGEIVKDGYGRFYIVIKDHNDHRLSVQSLNGEGHLIFKYNLSWLTKDEELRFKSIKVKKSKTGARAHRRRKARK